MHILTFFNIVILFFHKFSSVFKSIFSLQEKTIVWIHSVSHEIEMSLQINNKNLNLVLLFFIQLLLLFLFHQNLRSEFWVVVETKYKFNCLLKVFFSRFFDYFHTVFCKIFRNMFFFKSRLIGILFFWFIYIFFVKFNVFFII